ncbi:MAG: hypothetical protein H0V17_03445 [Deltaproteobacteria bacterium]|nr:hypothetical protein [Deltaproteobacteria bacterium]
MRALLICRPGPALITFVAACASFESPDIVIDTRVLAMSATVPDQVIDIDLSMGQPQPADLLDQMVPSTMCALVADPTFDRRLRFSMTLCQRCDEGCCEGGARVALTEGFIEDPDIAIPAPEMCATVEPDGNLLGIVLQILEADTFMGLGGIDYGVVLQVGGEGEDPALDQIAGKTLRLNPRIPAEVTANANPSLDRFDAAPYTEDSRTMDPFPLPMGRCVDQIAPLELVPTQRVRITPVETEGTRETYVVPTIDGEGQTFTESPTYQWLAVAGSYSSGSTGGPRDFSGNPAPLFSEFRAPRAEDLDGPTDIPLWIIQRDERLGATWYETCIRVVP